MEIICDALYWISSGLLVPVIVALIGLFIYSLILAGEFFGQFVHVHKVQKEVRQALTKVTAANADELLTRLPATEGMAVVRYVRQMVANRTDKAEVSRLLTEFEVESERELSLPKMLSKLGPMLGLMGTLIPMGPALAGLATGDIGSMARNMQVAFATTVTGLVVAAIGYLLLQVRQRWALRDMANLEYLAEAMNDTTFQNTVA